MSIARVRFTIDKAALARASEYAEATHRTLSELVVEALEQIQARYPKRRSAHEPDLDVLTAKVADILLSQVPAGTFSAKTAGVADGAN